jgi:hypothetical protein
VSRFCGPRSLKCAQLSLITFLHFTISLLHYHATGVIIANDANQKRLKGLTANCHRMGIRSVVISNYDGRKLPQHFANLDRILLDAPCTGMGVIAKDHSCVSVHYSLLLVSSIEASSGLRSENFLCE